MNPNRSAKRRVAELFPVPAGPSMATTGPIYGVALIKDLNHGPDLGASPVQRLHLFRKPAQHRLCPFRGFHAELPEPARRDRGSLGIHVHAGMQQNGNRRGRGDGYRELALADKKIIAPAIDPMLMQRIVAHGLAASERYLKLRIMLPDRPGQLAVTSALVAEANANVVEVVHTRHGKFQINEAELELHIETRGHEHRQAVVKKLRDAGYTVREVTDI